jgi:Na+/melibiose symporter-like transporter
MTGKTSSPNAVTWLQLTAYAAPGFSLALLISPFPALLMAFYAQHTQATTAGIATVVLFARIFNGVIDPPIGFLSDNTRTRWGPRKPWLFGGALFSIFAFWLAYMPPADAGNFYFAAAIVSFYIAHSVIDTPYRTWSGEISADYSQRSRLAGATTLSLLVGGVLFLAVPEILALPSIGVLDSAELDRDAMAILGWIGMVLMPVCIIFAVLIAPKGEVVKGEEYRVSEMITVFTKNAPFRRFISADFISQVGWAISYALLAILLDDYFGFGDKVVLFLLAATTAQIASVPVCTALAKRFGKHIVYGWCQILNGLLMPCYFLFPPDGAANLAMLIGFGAFVSALGTPNMMFPQALISDIADYDTLKTGQARAGTYFSMRTLLAPAGGAVGGAIGFYMLSIVGYDPGAAHNSAAATQGMLVTAFGLPMLAFVVSGALMLAYPITARRHAAIRARIGRRVLPPPIVGGEPSVLGAPPF